MKTPRPHPSTEIDLDKLKALRLSRGLTQDKIASMLGLKDGWCWGLYELGKAHTPLWVLRELYLQLNLDPLTLLELLHLPFPNQKTLNDFRKTCSQINLQPSEALSELISVFTYSHLHNNEKNELNEKTTHHPQMNTTDHNP